MKLTSFSILAILSLISAFTAASASEQIIATVSSDALPTSYKLVVEQKDDRGIKAFYKDVYENGSKIRRDILDPNVLIKTGMILEQRDKYVVMKLVSDNFDFEQGGIIEVDTLYNGASGERRSYEIQLAQSKSGWALFKAGKAFKEIQIQTNRLVLFGTVGIKNLIMK
jgi:hypothetical protein